MCRRPQLLSKVFCCSGDQQPVCRRELVLAQPAATGCAWGRHSWGEKPPPTQISVQNPTSRKDVSLAGQFCPQDPLRPLMSLWWLRGEWFAQPLSSAISSRTEKT